MTAHAAAAVFGARLKPRGAAPAASSSSKPATRPAPTEGHEGATGGGSGFAAAAAAFGGATVSGAINQKPASASASGPGAGATGASGSSEAPIAMGMGTDTGAGAGTTTTPPTTTRRARRASFGGAPVAAGGKCAACGKTVYPVDPVLNLDGDKYHKGAREGLNDAFE